MKSQVSIAAAALAATGAVCASAVAVPEPSPSSMMAKRGEPLVQQMVVTRAGAMTLRKVRAKRGTVSVNRRNCLVPAATPLAALLRTRWRSKLMLRDYGTCSMKAVDSAGLFVKAIGRDVNRGLNGWVYKVGRRLGTAGAADPAGPFGNGRLRTGKRVVWFYCVFSESSCQRSLEIEVTVSGRTLTATVSGYNDAAVGIRVPGVRVTARSAGKATGAGTTDSEGRVEISVPAPGMYTLRAAKDGLIPAFPERVAVD